MKVAIQRASGEPVDGVAEAVLELKTLEELVDLARKVGDSLIISVPNMSQNNDGTDMCILVYDDYIE